MAARMEVYFTSRDNMVNECVGRRVQVIVQAVKNRNHEYIGTLKAFDFHMNVILVDAYQVILNCNQPQRKDLEGVMFIPGATVRSIRPVREEKLLPPWPTKLERTGIKWKKRAQRRAEWLVKKGIVPDGGSKESAPAVRPKPIKLKRTWLTQPSSSSISESENKNEESGKTGDAAEAVARLEKLTIKKETIYVDQETIIKEEIDLPMSPSGEEFEQFEFASNYSGDSVKVEKACSSSGSVSSA